jgi:hypothetical protein
MAYPAERLGALAHSVAIGTPHPLHETFPTNAEKSTTLSPGSDSEDSTQLSSFSRVTKRSLRCHTADIHPIGTIGFQYAKAATGQWEADHPRLIDGALGDTLRLYDDHVGIGSESNFWSEDHCWFVYSDFDLFAPLNRMAETSGLWEPMA